MVALPCDTIASSMTSAVWEAKEAASFPIRRLKVRYVCEGIGLINRRCRFDLEECKGTMGIQKKTDGLFLISLDVLLRHSQRHQFHSLDSDGP